MELKRFLPLIFALYIFLAVALVLLFTRKTTEIHIQSIKRDHFTNFSQISTNESGNAALSFEDIKFATLFDDIALKDLSDVQLAVIYNQTLLESYFDDQATFYILHDAFQGTNYLSLAKDPVCVALTLSPDQIPQIANYLQTWPGSVSVAVFVSSLDFYYAIILINLLRECNKDVLKQVTWHLVLPRNFTPPTSKLGILRTELDCSVDMHESYNVLSKLFNKDKEKSPLPLPINTMRNVASRHCRNEWVIAPEVDLRFPSDKSIYPKLVSFFNATNAFQCVKCAFLPATYDILNNVIPKNKKQLVELVLNGTARVYHEKKSSFRNYTGNLSFWEALPHNDDVVVTSKINLKFPDQPIYITRHGMPKFDERYLGHSWTRSVQALEMQLKEYRFFLLDTIFLVHVNGTKINHANTQVNKQILTHHLRELSLRYDEYLEDLIELYPFDSPRLVDIVQSPHELERKTNRNSLQVKIKKAD
ncbi:Hypothetical predicted protein [Cloeon dipterum]|uniref:Beta-1,4-glucuronyltransferase 1 n=1 Tax=Cloeon dipterum TaxID=197152 RepID=A0A8S1DX76_9INSE|nr:Hypothetical predicted protein [Cloeon dipterum]